MAGPLAGVFAKSGDTIKTIGTTAVTAEALAVTYLSNLITKVGSQFDAATQNVLKAANASEQAHYQFLKQAGFQPVTTKFWVPDAALQPDKVAATIEVFEDIFVNAYLIGTTVFAAAHKADLARYAAEICGVEAEHRALARSLQKELPDNLAFMSYKVKTMDAIVQEVTGAGVGLGKKGASPGAFYTYRGPLPGTTVGLDNTAPDQAVPLPALPMAGQPVMTG